MAEVFILFGQLKDKQVVEEDLPRKIPLKFLQLSKTVSHCLNDIKKENVEINQQNPLKLTQVVWSDFETIMNYYQQQELFNQQLFKIMDINDKVNLKDKRELWLNEFLKTHFFDSAPKHEIIKPDKKLVLCNVCLTSQRLLNCLGYLDFKTVQDIKPLTDVIGKMIKDEILLASSKEDLFNLIGQDLSINISDYTPEEEKRMEMEHSDLI